MSSWKQNTCIDISELFELIRDKKIAAFDKTDSEHNIQHCKETFYS